MKFAALVFTVLVLGACSTAPTPTPTPEAQNFLDKLAGQTSLKINEWVESGGSREIVASIFTIQNGGRLLVKDGAPDITLKFVKELGNDVAQYMYYDGTAEKGVRYFTAVGGQIFISEALPDLTPELPDSKDFLDKVKNLTSIKIDGYNYAVSNGGKTFTDGNFKFEWVTSTGDYSAAYDFYIDGVKKSPKVFTWKNGYYISETVDFGP